ncbi:MAG TPA: hypothetical protein VNW99_11715 [Cytophagaceae bacterium]|jgi:hypothetical protein|nr:hypothetical protein [Cytophagaceae bacterium]
MTKTFTRNDVIRYVYNELNTKEKSDIELAMLLDQDLAEEFYELSKVKRTLNRIVKEPSKRVIDNILNYSKSLSLRTV